MLGGVFHDPAADSALISALTKGLDPRIACVVEDVDINNPQFAVAMASRLHHLMQKGQAT
jgi:uncharacterized protein (UPF0261 family)